MESDKAYRLLLAKMDLPAEIVNAEFLEYAKQIFSVAKLSSGDLMALMIHYAERSGSEEEDFIRVYSCKPTPSQLYITSLYDILSLFLTEGMNPNEIVEHGNILLDLCYMDCGILPAKCLELVLENGGDPNLCLDGETVFESLDLILYLE